MILRLGNTLARKIKESKLSSSPPDPNPFADWSARLFTAGRSQYILITNTASLYSVVVFGNGMTDRDQLIQSMMDMIRDVMEKDGFNLVFQKWVSFQADHFFLCKSFNRSAIGSMQSDKRFVKK